MRSIDCPGCGNAFTRQRTPHGAVWSCETCGGRAVAVAVLRRTHDRATVGRAWNAVFEGSVTEGKPCPLCRASMRASVMEAAGAPLTVDVCRRCQILWFDPGEYDVLPRRPDEPARAELPQAARLLLAEIELERLRKEAEHGSPDELFDSTWKVLLSFFFPVELGLHPMVRRPWVTWSLATAMVAMTAIVWDLAPGAFERLAWIPSETLERHGLTLLSGFLLHAGVLHLAGNVYFLLVCGDDVEIFLGSARFVVLLLVAEVAACVGHVLVTPYLDVPVVGASGAISGIIAFYAARFPQRKFAISFFHWYAVLHGSRPWWTFPAWLLFLGWALVQLVLAAATRNEPVVDVAFGAHLGGAAAGLALGLLSWRSRPESGERTRLTAAG